MIKKVKVIVKDRILTTLGLIAITLALGLGTYDFFSETTEISDTRLIILFVVGLGFIIAPEKLLDKLKI